MKKALILSVCAGLLGGCYTVHREERTFTPAVNPVTQGDVIGMSQAGYPDGSICDMIFANGVARRPTADDLVEMKQAGVSGTVMNAMLDAPTTRPRPAREERTVYVHEHSPEPALLLGFGGLVGYLIGRHHR